MDEFKKKTHGEWDKIDEAEWLKRSQHPDPGVVKAFLDTTLDNLLVEVEGIVDAIMVEKPNSDEEWKVYKIKKAIVEETKDVIREQLTRFKGEDCGCPITKGLKWHSTECVFKPKT